MTSPATRGARAQRRRHGHQSGFTLIELLVTIAVLAAIGGVAAVAFSAGLRSLGTGGAGDRLTSAHDTFVFDQQMSRDVSRAQCITQPGATPSNYPAGAPLTGSCATLYTKVSCTGATLCIGWPQLSDDTCHVAVYSQPGAGHVMTRTEWAAGLTGAATAGIPFPFTNSGVTLTSLTITPLTVSGYTWIGKISVTVTGSAAVKNFPGSVFVVRPLAIDPASVTSPLGPGPSGTALC